MLRKAGVGEKERERLISALMDLTGATDKVERTLKMFEEVDFFDESTRNALFGVKFPNF